MFNLFFFSSSENNVRKHLEKYAELLQKFIDLTAVVQRVVLCGIRMFELPFFMQIVKHVYKNPWPLLLCSSSSTSTAFEAGVLSRINETSLCLFLYGRNTLRKGEAVVRVHSWSLYFHIVWQMLLTVYCLHFYIGNTSWMVFLNW